MKVQCFQCFQYCTLASFTSYMNETMTKIIYTLHSLSPGICKLGNTNECTPCSSYFPFLVNSTGLTLSYSFSLHFHPRISYEIYVPEDISLFLSLHLFDASVNLLCFRRKCSYEYIKLNVLLAGELAG